MRPRSVLSIVLVCSAFAGLARADDKAKPKPSAARSVSECIDVKTEAIYSGYGYDHHVHLRNGCDKSVRCEVTTSSNPEPTTVTLTKSEEQDVLMFRGSPASEVSATTKCVAADES
jgi:hypothetical protein